MILSFPEVTSHISFLSELYGKFSAMPQGIAQKVQTYFLRQDFLHKLGRMDIACRPFENIHEFEVLIDAYSRSQGIQFAKMLVVCIGGIGTALFVLSRNESGRFRFKVLGTTVGLSLGVALLAIGPALYARLSGKELLPIMSSSHCTVWEQWKEIWAGKFRVVPYIKSWREAKGVVFTREGAELAIERFKEVALKLEAFDPSMAGFTDQVVHFYTQLADQSFSEYARLVVQ